MLQRVRRTQRLTRAAATATGVALSMALAIPASANVAIQIVSTDPYTNTSSYHATEVESDTYSFGSTMVAIFQAGRFQDGGASNLGWTTTVDGGHTFTHGFLPGTTIYATPPGPLQRVTDPAIAYDARHDVWMAVSLGSKAGGGFTGDIIMVNRSTDGGATFGGPVSVKKATGFQSWDSSWISCDNWATSPNFGHCYAEWDDFGSGNILHMSTSTDGGLTWHDATVPNGTIVIGGKPVAQPNGTVVVPIDDGFASSAQSFVSTNGGHSYSGPFNITSYTTHGPAGGLRSLNIVSADVDKSGRVYVVYYDCRFRTNCRSNDILLSTSMNGKTWAAPVRIPIDALSSTADHFLPGIAVDPTTQGATAHLALVYYFYPNANCTSSTCKLAYGFIQSLDGGATWSTALQVNGPITLTWLPSTSQGFMVGDYSSASFLGHRADTVFATARQGTCQLGNNGSCKEPMVAPTQPFASTGPYTRAGLDRPVPGARSDHPVGGLKQLS